MHYRSRTRLIVTLLMAAILLSTGVGSGRAQEAMESPPASPVAGDPLPAFAIFPKETGPRSILRVTQEAGTTATHTVVLANSSPDGAAFTGLTYAANVYVRRNGGLETGQPNEEPVGATAWIEYESTLLTLEPGEGVERTFPVTIPADAPAGEYIVALSFQTAEPIAVPGTPNLTQTLRQTTAIVLTVPGPVEPSFTIENLRLVVDRNWSGFEATIVNTGNVLVRPEGKLTISDPAGSPLMTQDIGLGSYFAFMSGTLQIGFGGILAPGDYLVTVELRDPDTGATAIVENLPISTMSQGELDALSAPPVNILEVAAEFKPDATTPQFLDVAVTINNTGETVENAELNIAAYRDGTLVENYVLLSPLTLQEGDTTVSSRYIPVDGFSAGVWSFTISVQVRNPDSGVASVLSTVDLGDLITIG